jgi:hypothetical protein
MSRIPYHFAVCLGAAAVAIAAWRAPVRAFGTAQSAATGSAEKNEKAAQQKIQPDAISRITIEVTGGTTEVPVDNASVYVKYVEEHAIKKNKKLELNVKTSRDGIAHVPNAPMGRALVQVIASGWKTYGRWYDITEAKQVIKIHLERPPKWY